MILELRKRMHDGGKGCRSMVADAAGLQDCQSTAQRFPQGVWQLVCYTPAVDRLSHLLPRTLLKHGFAEEAQASLLTFRASSWIASRLPMLVPYCSVRKCQDGELIIACTHPAVAQELSVRLEELEEHLSSKDSPRIRVRITRGSPLAKGV